MGALLALAGCGGAHSPVSVPSSGSAAETSAPSVQSASNAADDGAIRPQDSPSAAASTEGAAVAGAAAGSANAPEPVLAVVPPMPQGTRVLHVGDSMAGALGLALNDELKTRGVKPVLRFQTASFIPNWAGGSEVGLYLAEHDPDLVLITLGTNEMRMQDPSLRAGAIKKLVSRLGGRPCVWIAPPLWGDIGDTGLLPVIRANCAPCIYLDTTALYPDMPRLPDKTHPTIPARKEWARRVAEWLARQRDPAATRPWQLKPGAGEALASGAAR